MTNVKTGSELARGAVLNIVALIALNLRSIFTLLIAWILGPATLGTFALAFAVVNWLSMLGTFGLDTGAMTLIARTHASGNRAQGRRLLELAVAWGLGISGLTAMVGIVAITLLGPVLHQSQTVIMVISALLLSLPATALYRISNGASRGMGVMAHDIYSRGLTETLATIASLLLAIAIGLRAMAPVAAVILGSGAGGFVAFVLARNVLGGSDSRDRPEPASLALLRFSAPVAAYGVLNTLISRMDVLLLGYFLGRSDRITLEQLGIFVAAVEIAGGMRKVRQAFEPTFGPVVARQSLAPDEGDMQESFGRLARWVLAAQIPLVGVLCLSGGVVLSVFGRGYAQGALWLGILAVAHGTNSFVGLAETVIMVRRPGLNLLNSSVTAVLQIGCSVALISWLGATGAALGTLVAYLTQGVLRFVELRALFGWKSPWRDLMRPIQAGVVAFVPAIAVRVLLGGWTGQVYGGLLFLGAYLLMWKLLGLEQSDREVLADLRAARRK
jgi:O-antigen/teichoic acid export membrane protein